MAVFNDTHIIGHFFRQKLASLWEFGFAKKKETFGQGCSWIYIFCQFHVLLFGFGSSAILRRAKKKAAEHLPSKFASFQCVVRNDRGAHPLLLFVLRFLHLGGA